MLEVRNPVGGVFRYAAAVTQGTLEIFLELKKEVPLIFKVKQSVFESKNVILVNILVYL